MGMPFTVQEAAEALRLGTVTSAELTRTFFAKIDALDPTVGAFITLTPEVAMAEAEAADKLFAQGIVRSPLQGIPFVAKDIIATKTAPTTANSVVLDPAWGDGYDATVIEKLRDAGMVLLGKTVLSEFANGAPDPEKSFPIPQNPWDLTRSASGSSSGTGVAIASGFALAGLGTDTGGSTRGPSSFNGVTGMKQTYGRVSKFGCVPLGYSLDGINPIARTAYDCAMLLNVMAGYDPKDPTTVDEPVPDYTAALDGNIKGLRIGVATKYFFDAPELDPETKASVLAAIEVLRGLGASIAEVEVPYAADALIANTIIMTGESYSYHRPDLMTRYLDYGRFTRDSLTRGLNFSAGDYVQAQRFRSFFRGAMAKLFEQVDVIVTPTSIGPATPRAEMGSDRQLMQPGFTGQWNLAGLPAMAVPTGLTAGPTPLPLSMQLIGPAFGEVDVFRAGHAYQQVTNHHTNVPPIAAAVAV